MKITYIESIPSVYRLWRKIGQNYVLWIDLSGRVPKHCEEMASIACENEQVPDEMAVAQSLSREERHARSVREPPSHEPR